MEEDRECKVKMGQDGHDRGAKLIATVFQILVLMLILGHFFNPEEVESNCRK